MTAIAFLGTAHIHVPDFISRTLQHAGVQTKAVWDHDSERSDRNAMALGATSRSLDAVLGDPEITAVIIASETRHHPELVRRAAAAGKHMFVEKPVGTDATESAAMAEEINAAGSMFQTGYFKRNQPVYQHLKKLMGDRLFGEISRIRLSNCHAGLPRGWFDDEWSWIANPLEAGFGAFGDLGSHVLDLLIWLLGDISSGQLQLTAGTGIHGPVDVSGTALLVTESGATAVLTASWIDALDPVQFELHGSQGHALVQDGRLWVNGDEVTELPAALPHPFEQFLDAVSGRGDPAGLISVDEASRVDLVMSGLYADAKFSR